MIMSIVIARAGKPDIEDAGCLGQLTNNQAEYTALVKALERALTLGRAHRVKLHSDSELMVKQMKGEYKVKNSELRPLYEEARDGPESEEDGGEHRDRPRNGADDLRQRRAHRHAGRERHERGGQDNARDGARRHR